MKRQRVPYAKRSVWYAIAALSIVLIAVCVLAGYQVHHLQNQVNNLNKTVGDLYTTIVTSPNQGK
jgi:hypothetical protein